MIKGKTISFVSINICSYFSCENYSMFSYWVAIVFSNATAIKSIKLTSKLIYLFTVE